MTDRELLELCAEALDAIPVAAHARKFLTKKLYSPPALYAGTGGRILAAEMAKRIRAHLE